MEILFFICIVILGIIFAGWICYKTDNAESWEAGIKKIFKSICKFFIEGFKGTEVIPPEEVIDESRILSSEELLALTKLLEPVYEQIQLANGVYYINGIGWYDYCAYNVNKKYAELSLEDRIRLVRSIIRKHFQEIHGIINVPIYIKVCSKYRLYFAIPLNKLGQDYLEKQEKNKSCTEEEFKTKNSSKVIVEEVSEDDSGL